MQHKTFDTGRRFDDNWEEMINLYQLLSPAERHQITKRGKSMIFIRKIKPMIIVSLVVYIAIVSMLYLS